MENVNNIYKYLDSNNNSSKDFLIDNIMAKGRYTRDNAIKVYYDWKARFMNTIKCVPREVNKPSEKGFKNIGDMVIGKHGEYTILDEGIKFGYHYFNSIDEVEKYRHFRLLNNLKSMDKVLDEVIVLINIKL